MAIKTASNLILTAGVLLGVGMGGFFDGILFHQILQIHNMLSAVYPPTTLVNAEVNMFWDGLFHAFTWLTTAFGLILLWQGFLREETVPSSKAYGGSLILGWGVFNLIEGTINHHILNIHHVVERLGQSLWDYGFLASGVVFILIGRSLLQSRGEKPSVRSARPGATPL